MLAVREIFIIGTLRDLRFGAGKASRQMELV
jgi:hypothetical protein